MDYMVDIIVVNFNTRKYLEECLSSIRENSGPEHQYRVWVVDNGSTDGSSEFIRKIGWIHGIFNRTNLGYAKACNQGIRQGKGKYIFLLNSDTIVSPNWQSALLEMLESPKVAVVGPRLVNPNGQLVGVGVTGTNSRPILRGWGELNEPSRYTKATSCVSVCGACMGIKRQLIPILGLFDENYFHYFEETDYCFQARLHGYQIIYCPESTVVHRVFGSLDDQRILQKYFAKSRHYFENKWRFFMNDKTVYDEK